MDWSMHCCPSSVDSLLAKEIGLKYGLAKSRITMAHGWAHLKYCRAMVENLLNFVCKAIVCSQVIPVVLRKAIKDKDGNFKGNIEIFRDEEVIDAVVRFIRKSKLSLDEIALKNYIFRQACGISHLRFTRNVAVVYQQRINAVDGSHINVLTINENEEPADAVYRWCQENNVGIRYMESIMNVVYGSELVVCKRREPVYFFNSDQ
ncbi:hypothetical protein ACHAW5_008750 [Stephanodiscus triporus]|uniref:Uncharacterized protein n=1 Tax=Stephanodiscus triporus TaxID=2934178 RepID=A0ABD3QX29_9STRA